MNPFPVRAYGFVVRIPKTEMSDERKFWFPRKAYGWGWGLPCAWQGWLVWAVWLGAVIALHVVFPPRTHPGIFMTGFLVSVALLVAINWWKGESPGGWHWGD